MPTKSYKRKGYVVALLFSSGSHKEEQILFHRAKRQFTYNFNLLDSRFFCALAGFSSLRKTSYTKKVQKFLYLNSPASET